MVISELQAAEAHSILVIDDDEFLNELFCQFFHSKGFITDSAHSFCQAVDLLNSGLCADLILLDYQLGDGTGLELLAQLSDYLQERQTPVIMISGNEDPVFLEQCFASGVADYIIKPVNLSLLALKVSALIKSVSLQRLISLQNRELERFKQEAEREESIAKFTYEYLLRQNSQSIDGVSIWLKPSTSFSGDIALAKMSPSGDLYFLLADATGHGLSAAITVMPVVSIFNSMVSKGFHIQPIVTEINKKLIRDTPQDRFVAAVVIQLHQEQQEIEVWNGGMPTVYWVNDGKIIHAFKSQHMALGILEEDLFDANVVSCEITAHGHILAYSDGLIEETNAEGASFSSARVVEVIESRPDNLQQALAHALAAHTGREKYRDDVSICTLEPSLVLASCLQQLRDSLSQGCVQEDIGDFSWSVKISGKKIASCEIPPLCNKFLQYLEINQHLCQIVFLVVSEMISNAIDHGILKLESSLKETADGFTYYFRERERRLEQLTSTDTIELRLLWETNAQQPKLHISVQDSGAGYCYNERNSQENDGLSGRGLQLIRNLAQQVEVVAPGNLIRAVISPF
ncbi:fused response regulator/phosphatase [Cellvibrio sp. pealriver]|uniref:fused response regulator/phosphatase n=1 Tax=Cellvibrio sp. pealriver TaxID=1622269 RepID=UPI00066FC825|nr:fused response regulator/phosphatase [Cellvibrio sp. pealriver]